MENLDIQDAMVLRLVCVLCICHCLLLIIVIDCRSALLRNNLKQAVLTFVPLSPRLPHNKLGVKTGMVMAGYGRGVDVVFRP